MYHKTDSRMTPKLPAFCPHPASALNTNCLMPVPSPCVTRPTLQAVMHGGYSPTVTGMSAFLDDMALLWENAR